MHFLNIVVRTDYKISRLWQLCRRHFDISGALREYIPYECQWINVLHIIMYNVFIIYIYRVFQIGLPNFEMPLLRSNKTEKWSKWYIGKTGFEIVIHRIAKIFLRLADRWQHKYIKQNTECSFLSLFHCWYV